MCRSTSKVLSWACTQFLSKKLAHPDRVLNPSSLSYSVPFRFYLVCSLPPLSLACLLAVFLSLVRFLSFSTPGSHDFNLKHFSSHFECILSFSYPWRFLSEDLYCLLVSVITLTHWQVDESSVTSRNFLFARFYSWQIFLIRNTIFFQITNQKSDWKKKTDNQVQCVLKLLGRVSGVAAFVTKKQTVLQTNCVLCLY